MLVDKRVGAVVVALAAVAAIGLVGCDEGQNGGTGDEQSGDDRRRDQELVETAVLALDDLPAGWEATGETTAEDVGEGFEECEVLNDARDRAESRSTARADSPTFADAEGAAQVQSRVVAFADAADAGDAIEAYAHDSMPGCFEAVFDATIRERYADSGVAVEALDVEVDRRAGETVGDDSVAYQIVVTATSAQGQQRGFVEVVAVRVGRAGAIVSLQDDRPITDLRDELVDTVVGRMHDFDDA